MDTGQALNVMCHSFQVSSAPIAIGDVRSTVPAATVIEYLATASACLVYLALRATSRVLLEPGVQTASTCATAPLNTLPAATQRSGHDSITATWKAIRLNFDLCRPLKWSR